MDIIIGFSFGFHDSSVAVIINNKIAGIYYEERFSRIKHDRQFPAIATQYALEYHNIKSNKITGACYYEDPALKLSRIENQFDDDFEFANYLCYKLTKGNLQNPLDLIAAALEIEKERVYFVTHHQAHFFNALSLVPIKIYDQQKIEGIVLDGVGEFETCSMHEADVKNGRIESLRQKKSIRYPKSLGLFYSAITAYLGFEVNDAEFKVMGLAAYGTARYYEELKGMLWLSSSGDVLMDDSFFDFSPSAPAPYTFRFIDLLGAPAPNSTDYVEEFDSIESAKSNEDLRRFADIAASAQRLITEIVNDLASKYCDHNNIVAYCGGVALNTKANYQLLKHYPSLFISPDPGDGGSSLGAAIAASHYLNRDIPYFCTPYLGYDIFEDDIEAEVAKFKSLLCVDLASETDLIKDAASALKKSKVVGWVQGRAEFGPRALGNRSILANPSDVHAQNYVNKAVKFREPFRPFAPAVLAEEIPSLYDYNTVDIELRNHPLTYMLSTLEAKEKAKQLLPSCIHVDGSSRVQAVTDINPRFRRLVEYFYSITNIPGLLNTSYNLRGEPMVNNTADAISTFIKSGMDILYIDRFKITKS